MDLFALNLGVGIVENNMAIIYGRAESEKELY